MKNKKNRIIGMGGHDLESSAVLLEDGKIISAIQEERLNRQKNCGGFPYQAINYILKENNLNIEDIDNIVYPFTKDYIFFRNEVLSNLSKRPFQTLKNFNLFKKSLNYRQKRKDAFNGELQTVFSHKFNLSAKKINFFDHHKCHFATGHFTSGFNSSVGLVIDLEGDGESTTGWKYENNEIKKIMSFGYPNSLGIFYNRFTQYLGFKTHDEYKVMGLAAYGKPKYQKEIETILIKTSDGYELNQDYFNPFTGYYFNDKLYELLGPAYPNHDNVDDRMTDIACSIQKVFEDTVIHLAKILKSKTNIDNFVMAGGCSLNSKANGVILNKKIFKNFHIPASAGDSGVALGAAYLQYSKDNNLFNSNKVTIDYFGPKYDDFEIEKELKKSLVHYEKVNDVHKVCAELLANNLIIGWFQGRMEYGPRSLGNRAILADARSMDMKDKVNNAIKFREAFRPFAPICLDEYKDKYFKMSTSSNFMTFTVNVKSDKKNLIPAIVHEDGTSRVQTVDENSNKLLYSLLHEYNKITGIPVLMNTSFNVNGEPIVCSPIDAIKTFFISGIDVLIMNNYVVKKSNL